MLAEQLDRPLGAGLYLVATPIGNLADISLRALSVLARADLIAAEDTRHSRKLLSHFGVKAELTPYHEHNAAQRAPAAARPHRRAGHSVALISDAGTPLVSDPGYKLVREALDEGLTVISIPGPSAVLAGLTSAGLPTDTFCLPASCRRNLARAADAAGGAEVGAGDTCVLRDIVATSKIARRHGGALRRARGGDRQGADQAA